MITLDDIPKLKDNGRYEHNFSGLSTDSKPIGTYKGKGIANSSAFFELDTQGVKFYDESTDTWL